MVTKKAVLAGINDYQSVSDLRGCLNDVEDMRHTLIDHYGFADDDIRVMKDREVVKRDLLWSLNWLIDGAAPGDQRVFFFAGHGSSVIDEDHDETDGVDEILCLWDMDFKRPDSYLSDDDIRAVTQRLNPGVCLTIVFDCCHSGTATRVILSNAELRALNLTPEKTPLVIEPKSTRSVTKKPVTAKRLARILNPRTEEDKMQSILPRFIAPPEHVRQVMYEHGIRRHVAGRDALPAMNHVFLAAARDDQTAADAFIGGKPRGAFTYYFCKAARSNERNVRKIADVVKSGVSEGGFEQIPQLEPDSVSGKLFEIAMSVAPQVDTNPTAPQVPSPPSTDPIAPFVPTPGAGTSSGAVESSAVARIRDEVVQSLRQLIDRVESIAVDKASTDVERSAGQQAVLYVHGICPHQAGYSRAWFDAVRPHVAENARAELDRNYHEVLWSDLVTKSRSVSQDTPREVVEEAEQRERAMAESLKVVVEERARREAYHENRQLRSLGKETRGLVLERGALDSIQLNCLDDFAKYLLSNRTRRLVQQRFLDKVLPLLQGGLHAHVIAHSWGTVVAYEALRRLDAEDFPGTVRNLFTVGSALSIAIVQRQLEPGDYSKPKAVRRWVNVNAKGDFVGGNLSELGYGVDEEFSDLDAVGCPMFIMRPACPHSSYFKAENLVANRDVFARFILADPPGVQP